MIDLSSVNPDVAGIAILAILAFILAVTRKYKRTGNKFRVRVIVE
ncbi:MAG: hypothetical protein M5U29_02510 [Anaerolineae bacterium]|nr:hypothetical protein [Anaerolineae bacterium]